MTGLVGKCPVHACKTMVSPLKFCCPKHWAMVPKDLQSLIYATWKKRLRAVELAPCDASHAQYQKAKQSHEEAKSLALQAIHNELGYT